MSNHTKQRAVELAMKDVRVCVDAYDEDGYCFNKEAELGDEQIERLARVAIETIERWEKQHANKA